MLSYIITQYNITEGKETHQVYHKTENLEAAIKAGVKHMKTIKKQMKSLLSKARVCSGCTDQPTRNKINRLHKKLQGTMFFLTVENLCWKNILFILLLTDINKSRKVF